MKQQFENYTTEDFKVWKTLFERQVDNLRGKSCENYLMCLNDLESVLNSESIPRFEELTKLLKNKTGWEIEVVPGLIPVEDFFELLSNKKFCSSTWLRTMAQLDYLEEPDMFHDIFGHIPLFMNKEYADFAQKMGEIGVKYKHSEKILVELQRIYWFTIEFGLIKSENMHQIYGAGIISSFGETNIINSEGTDIRSFSLNEIINADFCNSEIQTKYYSIESFDQLYQSFDEYVLELNKSNEQKLFDAV
jgi:phenylalanine-4-hydroxylase